MPCIDYQFPFQVVHGSPASYNRMIWNYPSYSVNYDYLYGEPQPVPVRPVQLGGSRNILEVPNKLFNDLAKKGMGKHLHLVQSEIFFYWDLQLTSIFTQGP